MFKSFIWDFFSKLSNQIIAFIVSIFLARLLAPSEFGIVAIAWVVISFSTVFVDLGLSKAIIQAKTINQDQLSTVFFLNLAIAFSIAVFFLLMAGPISSFYNQPLLAPVLRTLSLSFVFGGLNIVQLSLLYRNLRFKALSFITTFSALISGVVGVLMAIHHYGVWSLVFQNLTLTFMVLLLSSLFVKWLPTLVFHFAGVKLLWQYSSKLFASSLLENVFSRLDIFIIGKIFPVATLGYYGRAQSLDLVVKSISSGSLVSVLFPYLSKIQDDITLIKEYFTRHLHLIAFITIFITATMFLNAREVFILLFTERWIAASVFFKILAISGFAYPINALMVSILSARGNSKAYLKVELQKKASLLPVYLFGFLLGIQGFLYLLIAVQVFCIFLNARFVKKEIGAAVSVQFQIIIVYLIFGVAAVGLTYLITTFIHNASIIQSLMINTGLFALLFLSANYFFKTSGMIQVLKKAKSMLAK